MRTIVTGGAGFIGSHLTDALINKGHDVIVIDDLSSGKLKNIETHKDNPKFQFHQKNLVNDDITELFEGVDIVFHVAAIPRVQYSIEFPKETNNANITGTLNVLDACVKKGVKRVVYSASSSAYGDQDKLPLIETMNPNPMSPYALQKLVGEYYCNLYYLIHKLETISLRYFNVFGPRQDSSGGYACLIPKTINLVLKGISPEIYGDGENTRDFTYVKDVVNANIMASVTENKQAFGEIFNLGNGDNKSVNMVVKTIIGDKDIKPDYKPPVIEPKDTRASLEKIKNILGWSPNYSFEKGINETIEWFKDNQ